MVLEIGSDFWQIKEAKNERKQLLWWENYCCAYYKSGRNALKALLGILKNTNKKVLLPAYTCETVIEPFLCENWDVKFYSINKDFSIDQENLLDLCRDYAPSVVYIQNYFGFNTSKFENIIERLKTNGIIWIEDITQSLFSGFCVEGADYYVASLRKFFAIPDGGVLISAKDMCYFEAMDADSKIVKRAYDAYKLKAQYFDSPSAENKECFRKKYSEHHQLIVDNSVVRKISDESLKIFNDCDRRSIMKKRKNNYDTLLNLLKEKKQIETIFSREDNKITPLFFPIYVKENRREFQQMLANKGIFCPVIWPKSKLVSYCDDKVEYIYQHILCIPIDQRYDLEEMIYISNIID